MSIPPKGLIISFYNEGHNHNHPQAQSFLVLPLLSISRQPTTTSHLWPSEEREVGEVAGGKGGNSKQIEETNKDIQREEMYLEISISSEIRDNSVRAGCRKKEHSENNNKRLLETKYNSTNKNSTEE